MNEPVKILKQNSIRITPQRVAVYEILNKSNNHLTADSIYEKISSTYPALSLATVYSILNLFKQKGLVKELRIQPDKSFFDLRVDDHHHFLCKKCFRTFDIEKPLCPALKKHEINGCLVEEFQGYFYGTCKDCRKKRLKR